MTAALLHSQPPLQLVSCHGPIMHPATPSNQRLANSYQMTIKNYFSCATHHSCFSQSQKTYLFKFCFTYVYYGLNSKQDQKYYNLHSFISCDLQTQKPNAQIHSIFICIFLKLYLPCIFLHHVAIHKYIYSKASTLQYYRIFMINSGGNYLK